MLSTWDVVFVVGVCYVFLGKRDLERLAKIGGRAAGWAVGYLQKTRGQMQAFAGDSNLSQIHKELQDGLFEIQAIREELRMGTGLMRPGSYLNTARVRPQQDPTENAAAPLSGPQDMGITMGFSASGVPTTEKSTRQVKNSLVSEMNGERQGSTGVVEIASGEDHGVVEKQRGDAAGITPLPVSAVTVGLAKDREGVETSGADIIADALLEEQVARQAKAFMETGETPGNVADQFGKT